MVGSQMLKNSSWDLGPGLYYHYYVFDNATWVARKKTNRGSGVIALPLGPGHVPTQKYNKRVI